MRVSESAPAIGYQLLAVIALVAILGSLVHSTPTNSTQAQQHRPRYGPEYLKVDETFPFAAPMGLKHGDLLVSINDLKMVPMYRGVARHTIFLETRAGRSLKVCYRRNNTEYETEVKLTRSDLVPGKFPLRKPLSLTSVKRR